ncbi:MAG: DUF5131 family protein [Terriglobales bacterium]
MSDQRGAGIAWTDESWNPIRGCARVSEGCRNCYAERLAARFSGAGQAYRGLARMTAAGPRWTGQVRFVEDHLLDPLRWRRPRRVFVNSMSDLFHDGVSDEEVDRIFAVMALAPWHQFQALTKRPGRMVAYFLGLAVSGEARGLLAVPWAGGVAREITPDWLGRLRQIPKGLPNVWLGVSVEDQATADERIPLLLQTPAAVRWVSAEPLLSALDLTGWLGECCGYPRRELVAGEHHEVCCGSRMEQLDWVMVGGESGPGARPMRAEWAESLQRQCAAAGVPFFMKQMDGKRKVLADFPEALRVRAYPNV